MNIEEIQNNIINDSIIKILNVKQIETEKQEQKIEILDKTNDAEDEISELKLMNKVLLIAFFGVSFMAIVG